jgi:outer membrane protein assembly factor BamB
MAGRVTVTVCPNCGGPLDPAVLNRSDDPTCPHCHAAVPVTVPEEPAPVFRVNAGSVATTRSQRGWAGLIGFFVVLAVVIGVVVAVAVGIKKSPSFGGSKFSTARSRVVPVASTSAQSDFYVVAPSIPGVEKTILRRVNPRTDKVVWSSEVLDTEDAGFPIAVAGPTQAFAIFGTNVVALDAANGHQLWRASLSNSLASPCDSGCAVMVGQELVTLAEDGNVRAFNVTTGAVTWTQSLNTTPRWLEAAGTSVLVSDTAAPHGSDLVVLVMDAATGKTRSIAPACAPDPDTHNTGAPDEANELFVSPDGTALTALIATIDGCAVRYRLADGAMLWQTPADPDSKQVPFTLTGETTAQSQTTLAWTNDNAVFALDTASGVIRHLLDTSKSTLTLQAIRGTTLVASSAPTFDPSKASTVAIDLATGQQRWQVASRVVKSGDTQTVLVTSVNPVIASCNSSADICLFEAVDLDTGTIKGSSTTSADPGSVDEITATVTPSSLEVVAGWSHIVGFDPTTAAIQWRWPS